MLHLLLSKFAFVFKAIVLAFLAGSHLWATFDVAAAETECDLDSLGFGAKVLTEHDITNAILKCGVVKLNAVYDPQAINNLLTAWLHWLENGNDGDYEFGALRGERKQTYLPFMPPFDNFNYLGRGSNIHKILKKVFGNTYYLDYAPLVVTTFMDIEQPMHRDTPDDGVFSLHVPLVPINKSFGPLRFCPYATATSSCAEPYLGAPLAIGDAILYNNKIYHSGGAMEYDDTRFVIYVTMLQNESQESVNEDPEGDVHHIFEKFKQKFLQLQERDSTMEL